MYVNKNRDVHNTHDDIYHYVETDNITIFSDNTFNTMQKCYFEDGKVKRMATHSCINKNLYLYCPHSYQEIENIGMNCMRITFKLKHIVFDRTEDIETMIDYHFPKWIIIKNEEYGNAVKHDFPSWTIEHDGYAMRKIDIECLMQCYNNMLLDRSIVGELMDKMRNNNIKQLKMNEKFSIDMTEQEIDLITKEISKNMIYLENLEYVQRIYDDRYGKYNDKVKNNWKKMKDIPNMFKTRKMLTTQIKKFLRIPI